MNWIFCNARHFTILQTLIYLVMYNVLRVNFCKWASFSWKFNEAIHLANIEAKLTLYLTSNIELMNLLYCFAFVSCKMCCIQTQTQMPTKSNCFSTFKRFHLQQLFIIFIISGAHQHSNENYFVIVFGWWESTIMNVWWSRNFIKSFVWNGNGIEPHA